jgi:hypothetical protein
MSIVYSLVAFPPDKRPMAIVLGITTPQFGPPLARLVPVEALAAGGAHGLHLIELGVALLAIAAFSPCRRRRPTGPRPSSAGLRHHRACASRARSCSASCSRAAGSCGGPTRRGWALALAGASS